MEKEEHRTKNEVSQRRKRLNTECCHRSQGRRGSQEKDKDPQCQMFQTGGEKGHWDWHSDLLVALSRVVEQKPDCSVSKREWKGRKCIH